MLSVNDFKPEAVIVGAGEFPSHPIPLKWLEGCQRVVCCDGAADRYLETGMPIWRIVGDCDSLSPENSLRHAPICRPGNQRPDQGSPISARKRLQPHCHHSRHRHEGGSHPRQHQPAHRLHEAGHRRAHLYRLWRIHPRFRERFIPVSRRHASVNIQLWSNEIPRRRIALSTPRLYKLVAGHTQRHRQRRLLNRSRQRLPRIHKLRKIIPSPLINIDDKLDA